jgi:capsular exopolysaccharide synthesis family protein
MILSQSSTSSNQEAMPRFLSTLWERKKVILFCTVTGLGLAAVGYVNAPVRYKAEVILALDVRKLQALPTESVISPLPQESPVLRTELDIISSRSMAERVLAALKKPDASSASLKQDRPYPNPSIVAPALTPAERDAQTKKMVDDLMSNVRVANDGRSYTIYISYYDSDAAHAAEVANAFGEAYIDYQIDLQTSATRRVSEWLGERLVSLRTKLEESERQATEFREQAGLVETGGVTLQAQQISGLNAELIALRAKLAGSEARLSTALEAKNSSDGLGLSEVLSSPSIQLLRAEEARVKRAIAEIDQSGARMNSQLPQLTSQLNSLKGQIATEISQIVDSLRNEIDVNHRQQSGIQTSLNEVQTAMSKTSQAIVQSGQLDREANANRTIYESYLARYKQTIEQDGIATAEARIISRAMPSRRPTSPNAQLWGLAALIAGLSVGVVIALVLHVTDKSVRSIKALEAKTGLNVIGRIPRISRKEAISAPGLLSSGAPDFTSAIADLQAYLRLSAEDARVIAFTSSSDREGKTFVLANLARSLTATGVRTIVIDGNLRNPALFKEFSAQPAPHLTRIMAQEISVDDAIQHDKASSVDLIVAQQGDQPPEYILGNRRFSALIDEMRQRYDLVLIDAPSAANGLDLLRIASFSDTIALVVRKEMTNTEEIQLSIRKLQLAGRNISGIVMNGVPRQRQSQGFLRWVGSLLFLPGKLRQKPNYKSPRPIIAQNVR